MKNLFTGKKQPKTKQDNSMNQLVGTAVVGAVGVSLVKEILK